MIRWSSTKNRGWYNRWMRSVISVKTSQTSHQSIFAGLTDQSPIMEHRHQPDQDCSTWHSTVTTILKFFNSARRSQPELLSVLIIAGYGIPCTYGNIAYIDINCKNNRQMPAAWKVWRIGVKILFVFPSLPAPSQCPHTLCIYSPQLSWPAGPGEPTEKLRSWSWDWHSGNSFVSQIRGVFPTRSLIGILIISTKPSAGSLVSV